MRAKLIAGVPVMAALPSRVHQEIVTEIVRQLANYLEGKKCKVYPAPFAVRLVEKSGDGPEAVGMMVEPDISIICDPGKLDHTGCGDAPDMVIEVTSPSTHRQDRLTKFNLYQRAGVAEYWIVDPVYKSVQVFLLVDGSYRAVEFYTAADVAKVNVLEGCFVELSKVFADG